MTAITKEGKEQLERKIRILKSLIKADLAKRDVKALRTHRKDLATYEYQYKGLIGEKGCFHASQKRKAT